MTQLDFAAAVGVARQTINNIEHCRQPLTATVAGMIRDFINKKIPYEHRELWDLWPERFSDPTRGGVL